MKHAPLIAAALAVAILLPDIAAAGDPTAGKAKSEPCAACHGEDGNSQIENVPSLAAQPPYYLLLQLVLFRDKQRINEAMLPFVEKLTDADLEDLAAYFSAQQLAPEPAPADQTLAAKGKQIADGAHCGQCHLPTYAGREQMARLAGQREDYLLKALTDFKKAERSGLDGTMTEALYNLNEAEFPALAHYLSQLR
jgi:cytochrome c553